MNGAPGLLVIAPGLSTMVQDLGRIGYGRFGLAPGGAVDATALRWANLIAGNEPDLAALEFSQLGPTLRWDGGSPLVIAVTGADFDATEGERPVRTWRSWRLQPGSTLRIGACREGRYGYLAVAGGLAVPEIFGSRSTDPRGRIGGIEGRALRESDQLPVGVHGVTSDRCWELPAADRPTYGGDVTVRVVLGTQEERFTDDAIVTFLSSPYRVTREADRMGVRLDGTPLSFKDGVAGADILSEGVATGAIQVPSHGMPIILLAAHQTTGGYSKIATVIEADLGLVAQARPGTMLRFKRVALAEARGALRDYRAGFRSERLFAIPCDEDHGTEKQDVQLPQAKPFSVNDPSVSTGAIWDARAVREILDRIAELEFTEFEFSAGAVRIRARRGASTTPKELAARRPAAQSASQPPLAGDGDVVTAPFLGVFYAAAREGEEPFVRVGDIVNAGQTLGLIEVMKSFHEVTAPRRARIRRIDVEDGRPVEFGQALFWLEPATDVEGVAKP